MEAGANRHNDWRKKQTDGGCTDLLLLRICDIYKTSPFYKQCLSIIDIKSPSLRVLVHVGIIFEQLV